jgi:hypothetical protein
MLLSYNRFKHLDNILMSIKCLIDNLLPSQTTA